MSQVMRARWAASVVIAAAAAGVLALPAAARATSECANLTDCTAVQADSWLVVPAGSPESPAIAGMVVFCPQTGSGLEVAAGSDYLISGTANPFKLIVTRTLLSPGTGLTRGGDAHFFVANYETTGAAIKPLVGCVSSPRSTRAAKPSPVTVEVRQRRLTPSSHSNYTERCPSREHLVDAVPGVLVHTRRPPTAREIQHVSDTTRDTGSRARFVVRIGAALRRTDRATLEMTAVCRR